MIDVSLPSGGRESVVESADTAPKVQSGLYPVASMGERQLAGIIDAAFLLFACGGFLALFGSLGGHFTLSKLNAAVCMTATGRGLSAIFRAFYGFWRHYSRNDVSRTTGDEFFGRGSHSATNADAQRRLYAVRRNVFSGIFLGAVGRGPTDLARSLFANFSELRANLRGNRNAHGGSPALNLPRMGEPMPWRGIATLHKFKFSVRDS